MQIVEITEVGSSNKTHDEEIAVGIDFGTTNSLIAISHLQSPRIIKSIQGKELIPSTIEFKGNSFVIGEKTGICSIKRLLGKTTDEVINNPALFSIVKDFIDSASEVLKLNFANQLMTVPEVVSQIFLYLKNQAEIELALTVRKAVITVPAHFNDAARGEIMLAAKIAGFEVLRLIAEPTAAAYAYGLNKKQEGCYLVYDLGGGTFDVSVLKMQAGVFQVIATGGDNMLGGDDMDHLLIKYFNGKNLPISAQHIKEYLTQQEKFDKDGISIKREEFEALILPLVTHTINITKDTLEHGNNPHIDGIILVGGATRIPLISTMLKKSFNTDVLTDIDPDKVVAWGAALQAENLANPYIDSLVIDVVPLTLGMELYGGLVEKIILRNSPLPISVTKEFTTYADYQTAMQFHILQGERETVSDCKSLAKFELKNLPLMKAGSVRVEVTFSIDADGILSVLALEKLTGKSHSIELKPTYGLKKREIDKILEQAYRNANNDHVNRLLQETIIYTKSLIYNVENAIKEMPNLLPDYEMAKIVHSIKGLKKVINTGNRALIIKHCREFEAMIKRFVSKRLDVTAEALLKGKHIDRINRR